MIKLTRKHRKIVKQFMSISAKTDNRRSCYRQLFFAGIEFRDICAVFVKISKEIGENNWYSTGDPEWNKR